MGRLSAAANAGRTPSSGASQDKAEQQLIQNQGGSPAQVDLPTQQLAERTPQTPIEQVVSNAASSSGDRYTSAADRAYREPSNSQPLLQEDPDTGEAFTSDQNPQFNSLQDQQMTLDSEQARRSRPTWEQITPGLDTAREQAELSGDTNQTFDEFKVVDPFKDDVDLFDSEPIISDIGDVESPFKFDIKSNNVNTIIQQELVRPEFKSAAIKLGITDTEGNVDPQAGSQLMFALSAQVLKRGVSLESEISSIEKEYDQAKKTGKDKQLDSKKRNASQRKDERLLSAETRPEFDSFRAPEEALSYFEELRTPASFDEQGGTKTTKRKSNLSNDDSKEFMNTMLSRLAEGNVGLLEVANYKDPSSGKNYTGYKATQDFYNTISGISDELRFVNLAYVKDVSFTPMNHGLDPTQAAMLHNQRGKTTGNFDVHGAKDATGNRTVSNSLDYLGTNANLVLDGALASQVGFLEQVFSNAINQPPGSFEKTFGVSTHPMASLFQKDSKTFFKKIPNNPWQSYAEMKRDFEGAAATDPAKLEQLNINYLYPARDLFDSASASYVKPILDGARVRGKNIFYPQNLQGQSGRQMDGTTVLNMQSNKKSRGLVGSSFKTLVRGRTVNDISNGVNKPSDKASRNFEAMVARNLMHSVAEKSPGINNLVALFQNNINMWADAAIYLSDTSLNTNQVKSWTGTVTEFVNENKSRGVKSKQIRPGGFGLSSQFPSTGVEYAKDSDVWIRKKVTGTDLSGQPIITEVNTGKTHGEMRKELAKVLELVNDKGDPNGKVDEADISLNTLLNLGKYLSGKPFHADLVAEVDGKNSSFAITSIQQGDQQLAEFSGVYWNPENNSNGRIFVKDGVVYRDTGDITTDNFEQASVVPLGDIRDFVHSTIITKAGDGQPSILDEIYSDPEERMMWNRAYALIAKHKLVKDAHKVPAMTTGYGKAAGGHADSMRQLVDSNSEFKKQLFEVLGLDATVPADHEKVIKEMTKIEEVALKGSLGANINQTNVLKLVGNAAAIIGSDVVMYSPSGYPMHMSAHTTRLVGDIKKRQTTTGGTYDVANFERVVDPTQRVEGDYQQKLDATTSGKKTAFKMENRIGVNSIHGVDASIVHTTASDVKKINERNKGKQPVWFRQVYDAFLVDINSFDTVVDKANDNFIKNNKEWNIFSEGKSALNRVYQDATAKAKKAKENGLNFDVSPDGEYKEFFNTLKNLNYIANSSERKGLVGFRLTNEQVSDLKANLRKIGFDKENGKQMTPEEFLFAFKNIFLKATGVIPTLTQYEGNANKNKSTLINNVVKQTENLYGKGTSPYASVRQYG